MTSRRAARVVASILILVGLTSCASSRNPGSGSGTGPSTTAGAPTTPPGDGSATSSTQPGGEAGGTTSTGGGCDATGRLEDGPATLTSSGQERSYLVEVPADFDPTRPTPLVLNFHGSGSNKEEQAGYSQLPARGAAAGFVVVTPDGTGTPRGWDLSGDLDTTFVEDLLTTLAQGMCIDPSRIFATGISNGSAFSAILTCRSPYRIAAVGMVAAEVPPLCPEGVIRSAIAFHGTEDPVVPYGGGKVETGRGLVAPGAESAMARWAAHAGCGAKATDTKVAAHVVRRTWPRCKDGSDVVFYKIRGGGHTWPGAIDVSELGITDLGPVTNEIDATDVILDFFTQHPLVSPPPG